MVKSDIKLKNTPKKQNSQNANNKNKQQKPVKSVPKLLKKALNKIWHRKPVISIVQTGKVRLTQQLHHHVSAVKYVS